MSPKQAFSSANVLFLFGLLGILFFEKIQADLTTSIFNQSLINEAMKLKPITYENYEGYYTNVVKPAQAFYYLTLVASINPKATSSDKRLVKDQVLLNFRNLVSGSKEPRTGYPLNGWSDGAVALSLALIKHTDHLWNSLNQKERNQSDWIMKALAINGNWMFNDNNNYYTGLGSDMRFMKVFNPNYIQGYMAVMIAFSLYFGPTLGDEILTNFDYNTYMDQFKEYKWTNLIKAWEKTGRVAMENGGIDRYQGKGKGVKIPFIWNHYGLDQINGIFYSNAVAGAPAPMYSKIVVDSIGHAHILNGSSPVLGQLGMCLEFNSGDSHGLRSSAGYAFVGWMCSVITRATMMKLGVWGGPNATIVEERMYVGSTDLIYKLSKGYLGTSLHGHILHDDSPKGEVAQKGYYWVRDIWYSYINKGVVDEILHS